MDPTSMHILKRRILGMKTNEVVRKAITEYYEERGVPEPIWRIDRNDSWFKLYCKELNEKETKG